MRIQVRSKWLLFFTVLAVAAVAAVTVPSINKENPMRNDGNETVALDISIPLIDTLVPEVTGTATFALG